MSTEDPVDTGSADGLIDPEALEALRSLDRGRPGFLDEILTQFRQDTSERLERMKRAHRTGRAEVRGDAHALKSSAGIFGARTMSVRASELEALASSGDEPLLPGIERLALAYDEALRAIERELNSSDS